MTQLETAIDRPLFGFRTKDGEWFFYTRGGDRPAQGDTHRCIVCVVEPVENPKLRRVKEVRSESDE